MEETFDVESLGFPEINEGAEAQNGNEQVVETPTQPTETVVEPAKVEETEAEPEQPKSETTTEPEVKISNPPSKYAGESDIQFNIRKQIYDAGQAKAQAETEEEKSALAQHIKGLRKELAMSSSKIEATELPKTEAQSEEELAKIALEKMGYVSKDKIEEMVQSMISNTSREAEHKQAIDEFYSSHKDIASNKSQKEVLERFVVEKFNITPQSTRQDLLIAMDMARSYLFPKVDTRAERAASSADKRDLVSISSNTQSATTVSKEDQKAAQVLQDLGISMKEMGWD